MASLNPFAGRPADSPKPVADPNIFASVNIAAMMSFGWSADSYLDHLKTAWHEHRRFVEWVADGDDEAEWQKRLARERQIAEKAAAVERADKEAEARRVAEAQAAYAAK